MCRLILIARSGAGNGLANYASQAELDYAAGLGRGGIEYGGYQDGAGGSQAGAGVAAKAKKPNKAKKPRGFGGGYEGW